MTSRMSGWAAVLMLMVFPLLAGACSSHRRSTPPAALDHPRSIPN